jgi:hypothetical protein
MGFKRKQSRIDVGRSGRLQRASLSAACTVLDVSESGVRIESRLFVKTGETLQLTIDLDQGRILSCAIQPVYVRSPRFGARITSISPEDQERLSSVLDDRVHKLFSSRSAG